MDQPDCVEVTTGSNPVGAVVWLHGLGADGHDFEPVVPELRLPDSLPLRFVFPHAPVRPVTLNGGMAMRAWYDIYSLDRTAPQDEVGIRESAATLTALVEREHERGIPYERIVVAGFSQGGAIAMHMALRFVPPLAGLLALSTWMPMAEQLEADLREAPSKQSADLPVFLAHGSFDPMLPVAMGYESRKRLEGLGFTVDWHEYPMMHSVCAEEIEDISRWLKSVFDAA